MKKEIIKDILAELHQVAKIDWNLKDEYMESIERVLDDYELVKVTHVNYCQACGKDFEKGQIAYYAPIDNNIICNKCAEIHREKHIRIVK